MNMPTSKKAAMSAFYKYFDKARDSQLGTFEELFVSGEHLMLVKQLCADGEEFEQCLETYSHAGNPIKVIQANRIIRVATHKHQARKLISAGEATTIDKLCAVIPKTNEPPLETSADADNLAYTGKKPGAKVNSRDEWHTPPEWVALAAKVMGSIDLDPFSSVQANMDVGATHIFTAADDALAIDWKTDGVKTVWMNPPYSRGMSDAAVDKLIEQYDLGAFAQAVVLMNSSTDVKWFDRLLNASKAVAFTRGRIAFVDSGGKKSSGNTKGQVFFYFGNRVKSFNKVFSAHCNVLMTGTV